jgi:hypothetical protein
LPPPPRLTRALTPSIIAALIEAGLLDAKAGRQAA